MGVTTPLGKGPPEACTQKFLLKKDFRRKSAKFLRFIAAMLASIGRGVPPNGVVTPTGTDRPYASVHQEKDREQVLNGDERTMNGL